MIRPSSRLLVWVAILVLPFSVVATLGPTALWTSALIIGLLCAVALIDAALTFGQHQKLKFLCPDVVRLTKGREGKIEVKIQNGRQKLLNLRLGLAAPAALQTRPEELSITVPADTEWSRFEWPCLPRERGLFHLSKLYLESLSPLKFWAFRSASPLHSEIRIYPNLLTDRKNLAALFLNRGSYGVHAQRQVGRGRDFEKLREYIPGDSFDEIHWKATAKRGHPVTKVYQIERTQEIYVLIDASRLSARFSIAASNGQKMGDRVPSLSPSDGERVGVRGELEPIDESNTGPQETCLERYITAALLLVLAAEQQGDLFGMLTFSDKVHTFLRARNGKSHYHACRDALYTLTPATVSPDYEEVASFIRLRLRRRALLVVLTALDDPVLAESFVRSMELLCRQHLVLVNMLQPPGLNPLFSHVDVHSIEEMFQALGGHLQWQKLRELQRVLQRRGVQFSLLPSEKLSASLVAQYLNVKRRQTI